MPTIFDVLYREFCRARLAEMRKQLLLRPNAPAKENRESGQPDDEADSRQALRRLQEWGNHAERS